MVPRVVLQARVSTLGVLGYIMYPMQGMLTRIDPARKVKHWRQQLSRHVSVSGADGRQRGCRAADKSWVRSKMERVHLVGAASPSTVGRAFRVCVCVCVCAVHDRHGEGLLSLHVHQNELQAENYRVLVDVSTAVACLSKFACGRVVLQPCGRRSCNRFIVCCPLWPSYVWTGCDCPSAVTQAAGTYSTVQCCRAFCYVFPNYPVLADGSLDSYLDYQLHIMRWVEKCMHRTTAWQSLF